MPHNQAILLIMKTPFLFVILLEELVVWILSLLRTFDLSFSLCIKWTLNLDRRVPQVASLLDFIRATKREFWEWWTVILIDLWTIIKHTFLSFSGEYLGSGLKLGECHWEQLSLCPFTSPWCHAMSKHSVVHYSGLPCPCVLGNS